MNPKNLNYICEEGRWIAHDGNRVYAAYLMNGAALKPYISVLPAPSGRNLLADAPHDHIHHHGVWWGHGDVNGVTFYLELPSHNPGRILHREYVSLDLKKEAVGFTQILDWNAPTGETLLQETRRIALLFNRNDGYALDLESAYEAQTDIAFGTTKESAMPIIRMADAFNGKAGGAILNSEGGRGEKETFGQPARWVDYSAPVPERYGKHAREGLACLDHPSNPHHPNRWFTREYGPLSPREGHLFTGAETLPKGDVLRLKHRVIVHKGGPEEADIEAAWQAYADE